LSVGGCGQKGPLTLTPKPATQPTAQPSAKPSASPPPGAASAPLQR
jgi:predicted small lipoprotein YifL